MSTNQAQIKEAAPDIEWGAVEGGNTEFTVHYPRAQWIHGNKQASGFMKTGGLFIAKEQYPNFEAEGFEPTVLITREGEEIEGFAARRAKLAVIRIKHQWVKDETYGRNIPLAHALVSIKGCDDLFCVSLRGATKALEFQNAFNRHIGQNVSLANRTRPQGVNPLEPFALWFAVEASEMLKADSKDGKSSSPVTPPILTLPEKHDLDYVRSLWVGAENYKRFAGFFKETTDWQKLPIWEQRGNTEPAEFTGDNNGDAATDQQLQHLINLCTAKGFTEAEIMQGITHGARTHFDQLTKDEARQVIDSIAAK
jgi:hypothetical protein